MRITSAINAAALLAFMLGPAGLRAQEPIAPATAAGTDETAAPVSAHSKIRIVRLSEVKGAVQLDRQTGKGFELAMANLPVVEGEKLKTGDGVAEIEFEDNSTVRVAQNSMVEFPRLELLPSGAKASTLTVLQGTVYISLINTKGNEFTVNAGQQKITLPPDTHIRLQLTGDQASLAVMHGEATVEEASGPATVGKNKTMTFSLEGQGEPVVARSVADQPLDSWDKDAVQYHKSFANASSFGNSPYSYGLNDLNYYGSFSNVGGCGSMWRPYFASAAWDPYGSGAWAYYPTAGYSWVSPYPWGWTPYHYGSWAFCQGVGWGWMPGGSWMGLNNYAYTPLRTSTSSPIRPHPPIHAPASAQSALVPVNLKAIPTSTLGAHDTFVFRQDSAGLGVPRAALGKLNSFSNQTAQRGAATTNLNWGGEAQRGSFGAAERGSFGAAERGSSSRSGPASASSPSFSSSMQSGISSSGGSHASSGAGAGGSGRH